ncbi:putative membrane protein [Escherichia coli DEC7D]|nr:putative membrane protein [Escherichia coli DEC7D]
MAFFKQYDDVCFIVFMPSGMEGGMMMFHVVPLVVRRYQGDMS